MFYPFTVSSIRQALLQKFPGVKAEERRLGPKPAHVCHLLYMCDTVENMPTISDKKAAKAGRWIGWMLDNIEAHFLFTWNNNKSRVLIKTDCDRGFDVAHKPQHLGVDFGYVISEPREGIAIYDDPDYLKRDFVEGAIESLRRLVDERFGKFVWIVSKLPPEGDELVMNYLDHHNFWEKSGIRRENVRFCRERHHKALICCDLDINYFIDDRTEVLMAMSNISNMQKKFALRPRLHEESEKPFLKLLETHATTADDPTWTGIKVVQSWKEIVDDLLPEVTFDE